MSPNKNSELPEYAPNAAVALLRVLEYFEGTLFLTTNGVETIDNAFLSRVHLSLSYPQLSTAALRQLWQSWITRACPRRQPRWLTAKFLDQLSSTKVNGREIKNIVRMAHALARNGKREMRAADIMKGSNAMSAFEEAFGEELQGRKVTKKQEEAASKANPGPQKSWKILRSAVMQGARIA